MKVENATCPHCGADQLHVAKGIPSGGGMTSVELLPKLGGGFPASLEIVACAECGFMQFFVSPHYRKKLAKTWKPLPRNVVRPADKSSETSGNKAGG